MDTVSFSFPWEQQGAVRGRATLQIQILGSSRAGEIRPSERHREDERFKDEPWPLRCLGASPETEKPGK